jgi:hypothetical protein
MLYSIKYQIAKDTSLERAAMISSLMAERSMLRWAIKLLDSPVFLWLKIFATFLYASWRVPKLNNSREKSISAIVWSKNELKHIEEFSREIAFSELDFISIGRGAPPFLWLLSNLFHKKTLKTISVLKKVNKKYSFPISARAAEVILLYCYFSHDFFQNRRSRVFLSTTQSHPHFSALSGLKRVKRTKLIFLAHSPCVADPMPISVDLGIFWGLEGADQFERIGSKIPAREYYFPSSKSQIAHRKKTVTHKSILISLSKNPNWLEVKNLIQKLNIHYPDYNHSIRAHPNSLGKMPSNLNQLLTVGNSLAEDLADKNFMIAGSSTVHLEAYLHGVPSFLSEEIDHRPVVLLDFLHNEGIFSVEDLWKSLVDGAFADPYPKEKYEIIRNKYFSSFISPQIVHSICELSKSSW